MVLRNHQVDMELLGVDTEVVDMEVEVMEVVDLAMVPQILVMALLIPVTELLLVRYFFF